MRKLLLAAAGLLLMSVPGRAQESSVPKAEVFGGFSWSSVGAPATSRQSLYGWQAAVNGNLHRNFGIVADFGGQYKTIAGVSTSNTQFLFGPQISVRQERITPFVHALFGANRTSASVLGVSASSTNLGLGIGGGLDLNVSQRLALRVPQFDWTPVRAAGVWNNNIVRLGFGVVFKLGER